MISAFLLPFLICSACSGQSELDPKHAVRVRVATYNIEDVRSEDLLRPDHPRLMIVADEIRELRPDIVLLNEIAYDWPADSSSPGGMNGHRFVENFLVGNPDDLRYQVVMAQPNTGLASGFDLDHSGQTVAVAPELPRGSDTGEPGSQTAAGRAYGGDSWGFGMFPGQYGMAILVSDRFEVSVEEIRTFQNFKWSAMPEPVSPIDPATDEPWYDEDTWSALRLSSKTHIDVPVVVGPQTVLHVLASHPTPPAFDGPEGRNKARNHDEIRFWSYYLDGREFIVDDNGVAGGLAPDANFVIVGDLNADPDEGSSHNNPIESFLINHSRVNGDFVPEGDVAIEGLDVDDTARWGLRVDYVLPSVNVDIVGGAIHRHPFSDDEAPSDHYPVWIDLDIPTQLE